MISNSLQRIIEKGESEFSNRFPLLCLWQELANNFYPQRANFTVDMTLGADFASLLTTSRPLIIMRTLQQIVPAILRPKDFFEVVSTNENPSHNALSWLEYAKKITNSHIYRRETGFTRAVTESDADFMCFGNSAKYIMVNRNNTGLIFRNISLKEICWFESEAGRINEIHRKCKFSPSNAIELFGADRLHIKIKQAYEKKDKKDFCFHHVVLTPDCYMDYEAKYGNKFPWVSVWIDIENEHIIEEVGSWTSIYVIPRWQTVSGFQYGYSPATQIALPDARLLQQMTLTALEASQKAVDPPLIATGDVVRGDVNAYAGGITVVDRDYDERFGDALRPMTIDKSGLGHGLNMIELTRASLSDALYENKLSLPPADRQMTATEIMQRVREHVRNALPLFAPIEEEDNAVMIENVFTLLMRGGAFGSPDDIPDDLKGKEVQFKFKSPLQDSKAEEAKQQYLDMLGIAGQSMQIDPNSTVAFNIPDAFYNMMKTTKVPTEWIKSEEQIQQELASKQEQEAIIQASQMAQQAGAGGQAIKEAMLPV